MPRLDTIILRLAGLDVTRAEAVSRAARSELAALAELTAELTARGRRLEEALHRAVQQAGPSKQLRLAALELKRAIHNGRRPKVSDGQVEIVVKALDHFTGRELLAWVDGVRDLHARRTAFDDGADVLIATDARSAIANTLADESFGRALRTTAWTLFSRLQSGQHDSPSRLSSAERKAVVYMMRAAWKTSPLSTFLYTGRIQLRAPDPDRPPTLSIEAEYATTLVNPALSDELQRLRCRSAETRPEATVRRHPRASSAPNGVIRYLKAVYGPANAGNWRMDRKSELVLGQAVAKSVFAIPASGQPIGTFLGLLAEAGCGDAEARAAVRILEREGIISIERQDSGLTQAVSSLTAVLQEDAKPTNARWKSPPELETILAEISKSLGISGASVSADHSRFDHGVAELSGNILDEGLEVCLRDLEDALRDFVAVNPAYVALVNQWHRMGVGAGPIPLQSLLDACAGALGRVEETVAARVDPATLLSAGHRVPVTAYFQIACAPEGYLLALNQAQTFSLSQSLRALPRSEREREQLLEVYREWLRELYPRTEPVAVPVCSGCNALQSHPRVTDFALNWGNETSNDAQPIQVENVYIAFDACTQRFALIDQSTGRAISLVYLGGLVPRPAWGEAYLLSLLSNPFQLELPSVLDADGELTTEKGVAQAPRLQRGSVVLRRSIWKVPSEQIRILLRRKASSIFFSLRELCDRYRMPPQVFMLPSSGGDRMKYYSSKEFRKPLFFDINCPALYRDLERVAMLSEDVLFVEALPGGGQQWLQRVAGQRRVSEFQVEFALE